MFSTREIQLKKMALKYGDKTSSEQMLQRLD